MPLAELSQSRIPGAVSRYGLAFSDAASVKMVVYDGQMLPRFLLNHGGDPTNYRGFLRSNKIGDPFAMLAGIEVRVEQIEPGFSAHPEA